MSVRLPSRRVSPAERRADLWLALALLIGAIISAWLGQVAGVYGDETPAFGWALVYSAALTLPLALRRRYPEVVLLWVAIVTMLVLNIKRTSFGRALVAVRDKDFASELRQRLRHAMHTAGRRVGAQQFEQRPWRERVLDQVAHALMRAALWVTGNRY